MFNTALNERDSRDRVARRFRGLFTVLVPILCTLTFNVAPLHPMSLRTMTSLRGDQVLVPTDVPPKERFVLQRLISLEERLIVFVYHDPRFRHPLDYAETYNLMGELLQIAWYEPTQGLNIARDINLGKPSATGPARILEIVREVPDGNRGLTLETDDGRLLQTY